MREEIIYRGQRLDNGEWVYGYYSCDSGKYHFIKSVDDYCDYRVDPDTVGQYTGRTDKNDNRIFDGDICNFRYIPNPTYNNPNEYLVTAVVEWSNRNYGYCLHNINPRSKSHPSRKQYFLLGDYRIVGLTIVGNKCNKPNC